MTSKGHCIQDDLEEKYNEKNNAFVCKCVVFNWLETRLLFGNDITGWKRDYYSKARLLFGNVYRRHLHISRNAREVGDIPFADVAFLFGDIGNIG